MDKTLTPSHSEEELTKVSDANSEQSIRKTTSSGQDQAASTITTSTSTPTSQSTKTERSVGASVGATKQYSQQKTLFHSYQIIWYIFGFIEIVLAFRFALKLLGANPGAGFTKFVYGISSPFANPFASMFKASTAQGIETTSYFEWSTLVAAFVFLVLTWAIVKIFNLGKPTNPDQVIAAVDSQ